jgi:hypothetical protein
VTGSEQTFPAGVTRISRDYELAGVRLMDVYRDASGDLWEVIGLCDKPQATFRRVKDDKQVHHVIGCRNMEQQFPKGPLR